MTGPAESAKQSHSVKLTPVATRCESSLPVATAECRSSDEKKSVVAILFADNTIRAYDTTSLAYIGPRIDLHADAHHTVISFINESTVVTGGTDGCLIESNVLTGHVSAATQAHGDAVVSIDSTRDTIVSVGRDNTLSFLRFEYGRLLPIRLNEELSSAPVGVKLVYLGGVQYVLVAHEYSTLIQLFRIYSLGNAFWIYMLSADSSQGEYRLVDIAVDESRTLIAAAFASASRLEIVTGLAKRLLCYNEGCIINTSKDVYSKVKVNWSATDSGIWVTNNDGIVTKVYAAKLPKAPLLRHSKSELEPSQVGRGRASALLAAAYENVSCLKMMIGYLRSFVSSEDSIISPGKDIHSESKVSADFCLRGTENVGTVDRVEFGKVSESSGLGDSTTEVVCLQVCHVAEREVIITGRRNGEITLWN